MATSKEVRLAPVTARDGVDTRNKDNSGKAAAGTEETTRQVGGDLARGGQTAALGYLLPLGAEVEGSAMNAYWGNYLSTAERYINGDEDAFRWTSYSHQQGINERDIERESRRFGAGEEMLNVYRQFYNAEVVVYLRNLRNPDLYYEGSEQRALAYALEKLEDYNREFDAQTRAAALIQQAYRSFKLPKVRVSETGTLIAEEDRVEEEFVEDFGPCSRCDERRMGDWVDLCADCYWTEDAAWKRKARAARDAFFGLAKRQNAIPSGDVTIGFVLVPQPEVDTDALIARAICPKQVPGWDAFWSNQRPPPPIRIPKRKTTCDCNECGDWVCEVCEFYADHPEEHGRLYNASEVGW